jgi:PTH1 family peptidyl-tRNA hydrolase
MKQSYDIKPKIIIGLGNPGSSFNRTRHNIGFAVLDELCKAHGGSWSKKHNYEYAQISINNHSVLLIKPQTYMNNSGRVLPHIKKQGIESQDILVVHDELEFPFGKIGMKYSGSARGHNGLKSLIASMGADFYRLRCGIDRPLDKADVPDYVLARFSESHADVLDFVDKVVSFINELYQ